MAKFITNRKFNAVDYLFKLQELIDKRAKELYEQKFSNNEEEKNTKVDDIYPKLILMH